METLHEILPFRQHHYVASIRSSTTTSCVLTESAASHTLHRMSYIEPSSWNSAANEAVREMVRADATPSNLYSLRLFYEEMAKQIRDEVDLDGAVIAGMWNTFGARCRASSVTLANNSLLWATVIETVISKQRDYGKENITKFGQVGLLVRVHDKLARLEHLTKNGKTPKNESLADTVLDLVGYSVLGIILARGWFDLELVESYATT